MTRSEFSGETKSEVKDRVLILKKLGMQVRRSHIHVARKTIQVRVSPSFPQRPKGTARRARQRIMEEGGLPGGLRTLSGC